MTETDWLYRSLTYTNFPLGVIATPVKLRPTVTVADTWLVLVLISETVPAVLLATASSDAGAEEDPPPVVPPEPPVFPGLLLPGVAPPEFDPPVFDPVLFALLFDDPPHPNIPSSRISANAETR
jgi:hypothetical protein